MFRAIARKLPNSVRNKTQAKKQRAALKWLARNDLYTGKIDLRKKPTPYQQSLINKFNLLSKGPKPAVVIPKNPAAYKGTFQVKGDKVIVPRKKGETVGLTKSGTIKRSRHAGGLKVRSRFVEGERGLEKEPILKATVYHVPFNRGKGRIEWRRFTAENFKKFREEYKNRASQRKGGGSDFRDWMKLVEVETIDFTNRANFERFNKAHAPEKFGRKEPPRR